MNNSKLFTFYNSSLTNKFHQPEFQLENLQPLKVCKSYKQSAQFLGVGEFCHSVTCELWVTTLDGGISDTGTGHWGN
jgi:hypothetical protein